LSRLRLISWNLHAPPLASETEVRLERVAERIQQLGDATDAPDFLLFQEVWFPSLAAQLAESLRSLYEFAALPAGLFPGDTGGLVAAVRRNSEWSIAGSAFHGFDRSAPAWRVWEGDGFAGKGMQALDCSGPIGRLLLVNTHLQAQYGEQRYAGVRREQLAQLLAFAKRTLGSKPVVVAGDLNTSPDEGVFQEQASHWIDLTAEFRDRCGCGTSIADTGPAQWLDYVLAPRGSEWEARAVQVSRIVNERPDWPFSDHHALDVTLELQAAQSASRILPGLIAARLSQRTSRREWLALSLALALTSVEKRVSGAP
jgi:hypothetical protein